MHWRHQVDHFKISLIMFILQSRVFVRPKGEATSRLDVREEFSGSRLGFLSRPKPRA